MIKYKYFFRSDLNKEAIGIIKSKDEKGAFIKAARKKQLPIDEFVKLFFIEELK